MKAVPDTMPVDELLKLRKKQMLVVNPEYQRGRVWTLAQKKRLVDSVLRGYPIPLIYLHHISKEVAGHKREDFEIIDGQQRITALYEYKEGNFKLFDPVADAEDAQFPSFIQAQPCPWGGKRFEELPASLQEQMLSVKLASVLIETDVPNEARDLFIRLQAGMPLNSQKKRDAWPGNFTEYVLKVGGKPELPKYPGHDFFKVVMKAKQHNRGEYRQLAAQIIMLYQTRKETGRLCDINRDAVDGFYYKNLDFDANTLEAKRFWQILDMLTQLLGDGKRKKVIGHEAIGLVLLVDSLWDDYTKSWQANFGKAFDIFKVKIAEATRLRRDKPTEYWLNYGQWTRANSDRAASIEARHRFFVEKMHATIEPKLKDPARGVGQLGREIIYLRDKEQCQRPGWSAEALWADAEIHHAEPHFAGGPTTLPNAALAPKSVHP